MNNTNKLNESISNKPYERFEILGPKALTESELIAIILRTGTKEKDAISIAKDVLALGKYPRTGLLGLMDVSIEDLSKVKGVGKVKAIKLKSLAELSMRMHKASASFGFNISSPASVAEYFMEDLRHLDREVVILAAVDSKGRLIAQKIISEGSVNKSLLSPRTVFLESLNMHAVFIILLHNHPSGDPTPSDSDIEITDTIYDLGNKLEIKLLDHIVIGDNKYFSFREHNLIEASSER